MRSNLQTLARDNAGRHHTTEELKSDGVHYTPCNLADFVAVEIVSQLKLTTTGRLSVCDPATGDGELLVAFLRALRAKGMEDVDVHGFELSIASIATAAERIREEFPRANIQLRQDDFLRVVKDQGRSPTLFQPDQPLVFDVVIANPPYVRTQVMGATQAQELATQFGLSGRVDLYHAFLLGIGRVLKPHGLAGVIVSNRFMTTKSGLSVRTDLLEHFHPLHVWDLGDTKLFSAAVLPAVLLLERKNGSQTTTEPARFTSIYSSKLSGHAEVVRDPIEALNSKGLVQTWDGNRFLVEHGLLDHGTSNDDVWRVATESRNVWLETVRANTWGVFGDIGNIRVGVKTTADKVFIRKDWHLRNASELPELLRPLTTHHMARRFRAQAILEPRAIVYPHAVQDGRRIAVGLDDYPNTRLYLEAHRKTLEARTYVTGSGRKWFEVWVPQDPDAWRYPKLVFRDISEQPTFWIDLDGTVVNGDCYWITCTSHTNDELLWLALAIGNSTFIEAFYDRRFNNKLYAGRRRFMTQYVEQFPVPDPSLAGSQTIIRLAKEIFEVTPSAKADALFTELDELVWKSFGLLIEEV